MAVNGDQHYYLASPISNAPVESLLQLLKHVGGRYMELPTLLQLMSLRTCKEAIKIVDVHDLHQHMGQLRAEEYRGCVRRMPQLRKEDAAAGIRRMPQLQHSAAPPQQQLTPAGTTPELAVPVCAPPQQQQQLAAASTSRKHAPPAANKSRAAKQGATHNSMAKRASVARLAWGEIA
ncbi:hypothetical protein HaLaN_05369, partial [Haematococcus lacustris]